MFLMVCYMRSCQFECFGQTYYSIEVFRAATHIPFLCPAMNKRRYFVFCINVKETHPFRTMKFMRRPYNKINGQLLEIKGIMTHGLNGVRMENRAVSKRHFTHFLNIEQVGYLVIPVHKR
ncbi:hypothetical protein FQZ97_1024930 [compost metagenome]